MALYFAIDIRFQTNRKKALAAPLEAAQYFARQADAWANYPLTSLRMKQIARWLTSQIGANVIPFPTSAKDNVRS